MFLKNLAMETFVILF